MGRRLWLAAAAQIGAAVLLGAGPPAQITPQPPARELVVGVFPAPPWSMKNAAGQWEGLTVALWQELAQDAHLHYRFEEAPPDAILDGVSQGRFDLGAGPFAATPQREQVLDFTHSYMITGVGIAVVHAQDKDRWLAVVEALSTPTALRLYGAVTIMAFLAGAALWALERRHNPMFAGSVVRGLGSGFWWAGVTNVGVGYGDKVPITFWGRLVALFWMFVSLILLTSLTAFVTAKLAVAEFGQVRGLESLRTTLVGAVAGSAATDFLRREAVAHRLYPTASATLAALARGEVKAVVYGSEILRYYAERDPAKRFDVLPGIVEPQTYAFPLRDGSALRDPINQALRHILVESHWRDVRDHYLGAESQPGVR